MKQTIAGLCAVACLLLLPSCSSAPEPARSPGGATREGLFAEAHRLYLTQQPDSAAPILARVLALDSGYVPALKDLASLTYERAMKSRTESDAHNSDALRESFEYFRRLEGLGIQESEIYERLGELSVALKENRSFLLYAKRNAEKYPYDRQMYNLGLAYFESADYGSVIRTQKQASEKFRNSNYLGGFYRQMGRAYMKMDRDQTAERTLAAGVLAVDGRLSDLRAARGDPEGIRRLTDDKIGMLLLLKKLHITYNAPDKLRAVERQLQEAGK
jgi:tetratricopeptide (TPR) repeat protein